MTPISQKYLTWPRALRGRRFLTGLALACLAQDASLGGWTDGKPAAGVIGQPDFVSKGENQGNPDPIAAGLDLPYGVAVDPASGKVFVADYSNNRVLRFPSAAAFAAGADAEAVLGQQDLVSDAFGNGASDMLRPSDVEIDSAGRLWVVEDGNNRVLLFENAATIPTGSPAVGLLGATTFGVNPLGNGAGQMRQPQDAAMGPDGTLWVADWANSRILKFTDAVTKAKANAADTMTHLALADGVLGQDDFGEDVINSGDGANNPLASGLHWPYGICLDAAGNMWVADTLNNRVLYFLNAAAKANGAAADGVLGAPDFDTKVAFGPGQNRFYSPREVALAPDGSLWVCEEFNRRAVRFNDPSGLALANATDTMTDLTSADGVVGQPDFNTNTLLDPPTQGAIGAASDIAVTQYGTLLVCDTVNDRVLSFAADADSFRPDAHVGTKAAKLKGKNVYSASGSGQKTTAKSKGGKKKIKFLGDVENDGEFADDFRLSGTKGNRFFRAKYFRLTGGRANITGTVVAGAYRIAGLDPRARQSFLLEVKPKSKAKGAKKKRTFKFTSVSEWGGQVEQGKFLAKTTK